MGETTLDRRNFSQDTLAGIVRRYLEPRVQINVEEAELDGVRYPVVVVPSHGARPVIAAADGPQEDKRQPIGVRQGEIYIRATGPESVAIRSPDDWNSLLDRCLAHRADLLGKIMRQTIARPSRPSRQAMELLSAAIEATGEDFSAQTAQLAEIVDPANRDWCHRAGKHFSILGYGLVAEDGELLDLDNLRALNNRVSVIMHTLAYNGWSAFLPLNVPERTPQVRTAPLLESERTYLEGMRLTHTGVLAGTLDYWRIYELGIAVTAESYWEDSAHLKAGGDPYITVSEGLFRLHSLLAHARLMGQETVGVQQVVVRMDWRGLTGRVLAWDRNRIRASGKPVGDRFLKTLMLPWGDLRDSYFATLRRVALSFFDFFPSVSWQANEDWLTRAVIEREFARYDVGSVHLFDD